MQILKVMSSQESSIYKPGIVLLSFYFFFGLILVGRVERLSEVVIGCVVVCFVICCYMLC